MPTKIFTTMGGRCPFGYHNNIDDNLCRLCPYYYRAGTGTFFWCNHPAPEKGKAKRESKPTQEVAQVRKRGRPRKDATKKPVKRLTKKK